jgi:hypothetical protein
VLTGRLVRLATITEMTLRDLLRRRAVLGLLFTVPLVFYLARRGDHTGQATRFLLLGLAFTLSTVALFATTAARSVEPRLRLCGYRVADLYAGRGLALVAIGLGLAAPYLALIAADQKVTRLGAIAATLTLTITVAAPLGTLLGAAVPRELEGTLLLIALVGAQMITDPANPAAKLMPFWSAREIATYAIDNVDDAYLHRGLAHGIGYAATLTALTAVITTVRLRQRHHSEITAPGRRRSTARPTTQ